MHALSPSTKLNAEFILRGNIAEKHGPDYFRFFETAVRLAANSPWGGYIDHAYVENIDEKIKREYDVLVDHFNEGLRIAKYKVVPQ